MATPRRVKQQAAEADRLHGEIFSPDAQEEAPAEQPAEAQTEQPAEAQEEAQTEQPAEAQTEQPAEAPSEPAQEQPVDSVEHWKREAELNRRRYETLKGKYDSEVPRLSGELRSMRERLDAMEAAPRAQPAEGTPSAATPPKQSLVTEQEIEDYGSDFVDFFRRIAKETVAQEFERLTPRLNQLEASVTSTSAKTVQQRVFDKLDDDVANWRQINEDPLFHEWLGHRDEMSGRPVGELLTQAFEDGDAQRVSLIFQKYVATLPPAQQPPAPQTEARPPANTQPAPSEGTTPSQPSDRPRLEDFAGPPKRHSGVTQGSPHGEQARIYTRQEVADFYADVNRGAYRSRPEEKQRKEAELHKATVEGRVQ